MSQQTPNKRVLFVRRSVPALLVLFGVFSLLLINFRSPRLAQAATSSTINFQARLETSAGAIAPDGNYNVEFKLYNAASTGTAEWTEDYTYNSGSGGTDARVRVANGYLSVSLGSITPFPNTIDWTQPQWITMNIGGTVSSGTITWDGEMSPRLQLTAVPYAFASGQLQTTSGSNTSTLSIQAPTGGSQTFLLQNQGAAGTYNLLTQNASTGIATLGTASTLTGKLAFANAGSANTITLTTAAETVGNATITIPNTAGANDTVCLQTLANCGSSFSLGTYSTTNTDAHGATLSAGVLTFQDASAAAPGMVGTGAQTFAGNKTFNGSTTLNNTTLAAGTSITITGGNTASRPASPAAGMLYYDSSTNQLLQYNGSKWAGSPRSRTKIVAASNSTQAEKDAADYVATGTDDGTTINTALNALPSGGGSVYLMEGTYTLGATSISVPNNTTLSGAGTATILTYPNGIASSTYYVIKNSDTTTGTGVYVQDLLIDGNKAGQTAGTFYGIYLNSMGGGSGAAARTGGKVSNVVVKNLYGTAASDGIYLTNSSNNTITGNTVQTNGLYGIYLNSSSVNNTITNNTVQGNGAGIIANASNNNSISSNVVEGNTNNGIVVYGSSGSAVAGNTVVNNGSTAIWVSSSATNNTFSNNSIQSNGGGIKVDTSSSNNTVTGNRIHDSGGSASNDGIYISGSSNNSIIGNFITDTSCTTTCYAINIADSGSRGTYLGANNYSGSAANSASINDAGTGTIYANQADTNGNLINKSQGGGFTIGAGSASASLTLQGGLVSAQLPSPTLSTTVTNVGTVGTTTYRYQVTALDGTGETTGSTIQQTTTGNATLSGTNYNTITWTAVPGAVQYNIYRCTGASCTPAKLATVAGNATSYNDTAAGSPSGAAPATNTTGGGTFAGALQGASGTLTSGTLTLGTASTSTGSVKFYSASGSGSVTLTLTNPGTTNYTLSIPALTGNDTICTVGAANCTGGSGSGVTSIGTYNSQTASANGAVISGTTLFLQSASGNTPGLIDGNNQSFSGNKTFSGILTASATGGNAVAITGAPTASATSSLIQIGSAISGGNASANGGTYIGLNAPSSGAGSAADFLNFEQAGTSNFQVTSSGFIWSVGGLTTNGNITVQGASTLSVGGTINTTSGYQFNGTSGATTTCSSGQFLQNQVVKGGISTGGTCAAAITTVGTFSATSIANGASISGNTITFGPADGTNPGMVTTGTQTFAGNKSFSGNLAVGTSSAPSYPLDVTGDINASGYYRQGGQVVINTNTGSGGNNFIGTGAGNTTATGGNNTAIGTNSLQAVTTGGNNAALGFAAGGSINTGSGNSSIGAYSGWYDASGTFATLSGLQNATAIGAYAQVQASNSIVLGSVDNATKVGIGITVPSNTFSVSPLDYQTGTATRTSSSATLTGTGTTWTSSMVGDIIVFADGTTNTVAGFTDATHITMGTTYGGTTDASPVHYRFHKPGFQVTSAGNAYVQSTSTTAFQVQNASGVNVFGVNTSANQVLFGKASTVNASLLLYNSTNANTVTIQSGATSASYAITLPTAIGTAGQCLAVSSVGSGNESLGYASCGGSGGGGGHAKKIILTPEYAGAVLDAMSDGSCSSANNGTMTSGYDSLNRTNFYNWMSSTSPSQCYDVVVQVPIPSDWSSWTANPLNIQLLGSSSNANYAIQVLNSSGSADTTFCASSYCTQGALSTSWGNMTSTSSFAATGYTADGYLTIKVRMVALNSAYVQLGNITLSYNSAY